jgi:hypothetical protein
MRVGLLLIDGNSGNMDAFAHWRAFGLELQQQATKGISQCHNIALIVKVHKNPTQGSRTNYTHLLDTIILQALRHRST